MILRCGGVRLGGLVRQLLVLALLSCPVEAAERRIFVNEREVIVVEPNGAAQLRLPLLIVLHGGLGNAASIRFSLQMDRLAADAGVRLAFVQGTPVRVSWSPNGRVWNAGTCCGTAMRRRVDDVDHLADIIRTLRPISTQVAIAGHSNGAMMALRVACERPRLVRRVIALSGPLLLSRCGNLRGVHVTHVHGARDRNVPVRGGRSPLGIAQLAFPPLARSVAILRKAGARVDVEVLTRAGHALRSLNRQIRRQSGETLQDRLLAIFEN